ncbi:hypothetical protein B0T14DRAFT_254867 [Immersiella caudata]|uniref:Uncharacterized protein n=1 Tax=Immersiella caudata TaxID=314043 RepID=A0AA39WKH0_9PEZI|nr:hypothetical protein B0T14DRAFT_254867 [Immersiella caudata]
MKTDKRLLGGCSCAGLGVELGSPPISIEGEASWSFPKQSHVDSHWTTPSNPPVQKMFRHPAADRTQNDFMQMTSFQSKEPQMPHAQTSIIPVSQSKSHAQIQNPFRSLKMKHWSYQAGDTANLRRFADSAACHIPADLRVSGPCAPPIFAPSRSQRSPPSLPRLGCAVFPNTDQHRDQQRGN